MKKNRVSAYVHMKRDTPIPLYEPVHILDDPLHSPVAYVLMDGLFLVQKINKNIPISYSLKYKHSKKNSLRKYEW